MKKAIFIGGVHGVGKTTFAGQLQSELNINLYNCGDIIRNVKQDAICDDSKKVKAIEENQLLLLKGLAENIQEERIILDGHFCLINEHGILEVVHLEIFQQIGLEKIIVLTRNAKSIAHSLYERDGKIHDSAKIDFFQNIECEYAKYVAKEMNIQIEIISI